MEAPPKTPIPVPQAGEAAELPERKGAGGSVGDGLGLSLSQCPWRGEMSDSSKSGRT